MNQQAKSLLRSCVGVKPTTLDFSYASLYHNPVWLGFTAELLVEQWLNNLFGSTHYAKQQKIGKGYDIALVNRETGEITRIEVKVSRKGKDGKYRATTYKQGHTDSRKSDVIVFLCLSPDSTQAIPFIIPSNEHKQTFIAISSNPLTYAGKYAKYRFNLSAFNI